MFYKISYGGFSVCSGNTDKLHFFSRISVKVRAHSCVSGSAVLNNNLFLNTGIPFRNDPGSSVTFCGGGIFVSVYVSAFDADENRTRFHPSGISGNVFYFNVFDFSGIFNVP